MIPESLKHILHDTTDVFIVGGSVRDLLMGRVPVDYDIAVLNNPETFAKRLANRGRSHCVELGKKEFTIWRVISGDLICDITGINGHSIEEDLDKRDFTINAMAVCLSTGKLIARPAGRQDLDKKTIRMVSAENLTADPVRLLRAFRLGAALNFSIEENTVAAIKKNAGLINRSAGERIREELFKLLNSPAARSYLIQMSDTGLLQSIFPELAALRACTQNRYHRYDVFDHTIAVFGHLEYILNTLSNFFPASCQSNRRDLLNNTPLLKCAAILHDIGKPHTKTVDDKGNIHFYGHEKKGAEIANTVSDRLKFSNKEKKYLHCIIKTHLRPLFLFNAQQKGKLTSKALTRFFIRCGKHVPDLLIHAIADMRGKNDAGHDADFTAFAKKILLQFCTDFTQRQNEPPLLTGQDLIREFNLSPSPLLKTLLNLVEENRLSQTAFSRRAALKLVKNYLKNDKP